MRYNHLLFVKISPIAMRDEDGNWISNPDVYDFKSECREEPNGSGRTIVLEDGKSFQFSSIIYTPVLSSLPKLGSGVLVQDESGTNRLIGTIARISNDRKNCRIWV